MTRQKIHLLPLLCLTILLAACNQNTRNKIHANNAEVSKGLKDYADFPIGNAVTINKLQKDPHLNNIIIKNFNSITSGNDMKMYSFISTQGKYNWEKADNLAKFCKENNQRLFGHTLVWHFGAPKWIQEKAKKKGYNWLDTFLKDYITTVVSRYKGSVAAWDVVNEAFETQGGEYRNSFFYQIMGTDYIEKSFRYAHAADPNIDLFYNDFNIERDTAKLHGVLKMIYELKKKNVPITGLGFQMHIRMDIPDELIAFSLREAAKTGLKIHISELDIIFNKHDDTKGGGKQIVSELTDKMRLDQAEKYKNLVKMYRTIIPKEQQYGITFWGCSDRDTWINGFFNLKDWPTIYNENLEPKPAYSSFIEGLTEKIEN